MTTHLKSSLFICRRPTRYRIVRGRYFQDQDIPDDQISNEGSGVCSFYFGNAGVPWSSEKQSGHYSKKLCQRYSAAIRVCRQHSRSVSTPVTEKKPWNLKLGPVLDDSDMQLYKEIVGRLICLSTCTRLDIPYPVTQLPRAMSNPKDEHIVAAKRLRRYLKGTPDLCVRYSKGFTSDILVLATATIPTLTAPFRVTCTCLLENQWRGGRRNNRWLHSHHANRSILVSHNHTQAKKPYICLVCWAKKR